MRNPFSHSVPLATGNVTALDFAEDMPGHPVTSFCYPNGAYDRTVRDAVARAGYRLAVTSDDGLNDATIDPLAIRRIQNEEQNLTRFQQSTSGFEEAKNRVRSAALSAVH